MVQTVIMPKLGQTVEESTIVKWHRKVGDVVKKGDIVFEIETDKAVLEVESFFEGTLLKIVVAEGQTVPVQSVVGFIGQPGDPIPEVVPVAKPAAESKPAPAVAATASAALASAAPAAAARPASASAPAPVPAGPAKKYVSPRARRLARDKGIGVDPILGTGPNGRVVEKDVQAYLEACHYDKLQITSAARELAIASGIDLLGIEVSGKDERITVDSVKRAIAEQPKDMSRMRQVIAQRLTQSFTSTPHFFVTVAVDMTDLLDLRKQLKRESKPFSVTDFIFMAVTQALKDFPALNSSTDGRAVRWHSRIHLGMAVSVKEGLVVPVIRNAQDMSLQELHDRVAALAIKARDSKLTPDEMSGSTFTVSNMGMLDVDAFTAIINPPEAAILAVASVREEPVVFKGAVAVRSRMRITLSSDHRIVDGAMAAKFSNRIKDLLEDTELWKRMTLS